MDNKNINKMNKFEKELYIRENNMESEQEARVDSIMEGVKSYITPAKDLLNQRFKQVLSNIQRELNNMIIAETDKKDVFVSAKGLPDKHIRLIKAAIVSQGYDLLPAQDETNIFFEIPEKLFRDGGVKDEEDNENRD